MKPMNFMVERMNSKPVFCGQEPSFMLGIFDTEEEHSEKTSQAQRLGNNPINKNDEFFEIYFHGELEGMVGFDVVCFVDGTMPEINYGDAIECITITPDDKKHDAIIHVGRRKSTKQLFCLVRTPNDKLEIKTETVDFKI